MLPHAQVGEVKDVVRQREAVDPPAVLANFNASESVHKHKRDWSLGNVYVRCEKLTQWKYDKFCKIPFSRLFGDDKGSGAAVASASPRVVRRRVVRGGALGA